MQQVNEKTGRRRGIRRSAAGAVLDVEVHIDVPPPPNTPAPPDPVRAYTHTDEVRAALRAIDDAAALRAEPRAFDVEGARDEPATWAEWFCANPVPEPATGADRLSAREREAEREREKDRVLASVCVRHDHAQTEASVPRGAF